MLKVLFLKELREAILSRKLQITFLACGLLALVGSVLMVLDGEREMRDHRLLATQHLEMLRASDANAVRQAMVVDLPRRPWQGLVHGATDHGIEPVYIHQLSEPWFLRPLNVLSANQVYAGVDLLFLITGLMSLLAVLLSHDLISRELETGTLRLVLTQPVSRDLILAAKWLAGFLILTVSLLALLGVTFVLLSLLPTEFSLQGEWGRMLGMTAVSLLLLSALFSLGLLVSCRCHQSANALVLLLFLWVVLALVIPSASPHLAALAAPTPAAEEISCKLLGLLLQLDPPGHQEPTLDEEGFQQRLIQLETEVQQRVEAQARLTQVLSYLSPVATGAHLMADLAGTGMLARSATVRAVRQFQQKFAAILPELRDPVRFEALPRLRVPDPDLRETLAGLRPGLTVLLLYNVVLFLGAHLAFLRQDLTA